MTETLSTTNETTYDSSTVGGHVTNWCPYAKDGIDTAQLGELAGESCGYITSGICVLAAVGVREAFSNRTPITSE